LYHFVFITIHNSQFNDTDELSWCNVISQTSSLDQLKWRIGVEYRGSAVASPTNPWGRQKYFRWGQIFIIFFPNFDDN